VLPLKAEMFSQENASGLAAEVSDWMRSNAPRVKWKVQLIAGVPLIGFKNKTYAAAFKLVWL